MRNVENKANIQDRIYKMYNILQSKNYFFHLTVMRRKKVRIMKEALVLFTWRKQFSIVLIVCQHCKMITIGLLSRKRTLQLAFCGKSPRNQCKISSKNPSLQQGAIYSRRPLHSDSQAISLNPKPLPEHSSFILS